MRETSEPFPLALRDLLAGSEHRTKGGRPNWSSFAAELDGVHYETLRRTIAGEQPPSPELMEVCARRLGIEPAYFVEYRVHLAQRDFDPGKVGLEQALANLEAWARSRPGNSRRG